MRDPYQCLAVPRSATTDDINKTFRLLAKKLHPDINKNDPNAAVLFAELNAAHAILGDKAKRRAFDRGEIDAEGEPVPEAVAISGLTLSVTGLMVAAAMFFASFAASKLIMRSPMPQMGISDGRDRVLSRVGAYEERAHLKWPQTDPSKSAGAAAVSESSADKALATAAPKDQNAIQRATDSQREPIEVLIGLSEKLISEGDIQAARILLQPAAEARDARAALALGSTYDPIVLAILPAHGVAADVSLALDWYKKAQELGSREAQQRLRLLAAALVEPKRRVVRPPIHVTVSHVVAPRVALPPQDPNGVRVAGDRLGAIPDPSIRDDASRKLPVVFGVSY
jgi:curved DNA-binding protein CbpA